MFRHRPLFKQIVNHLYLFGKRKRPIPTGHGMHTQQLRGRIQYVARIVVTEKR
mgnify:CR=1 FL=1